MDCYGPGCPLSRACCVIALPYARARFTGFDLVKKFSVPQVDGDTVLAGLGRPFLASWQLPNTICTPQI